MTQPPPFAHLASPAVTPASPQHLEQIAAARQRGKTIKRCAATANFSAWTIAIFGALTLLTSIGSFFGMMLGAGMCVLSYFEFQGAKEIRRLDPTAPAKLARNQLVMCVLLLIYAVGSLHSALSAPSEIEAVSNDPALQQMLGGSIGDLVKKGSILLYSLVGLAAVLGCGGTAWYYATRKKHIEAYVRETPPWIVELERVGMSVY